MSAVLKRMGVTKKTTRKTKSKTKRKPTKRTTVKKTTSKSKRTIVSKPKVKGVEYLRIRDYKRKNGRVYYHKRRSPRSDCKLTNDRLYDTKDNMTYNYSANKKATKKYSKLSTSKKLQKGRATCGTKSKTSKIRASKSVSVSNDKFKRRVSIAKREAEDNKPKKKQRLTKEQKRNMRRERLEKTKEGRATLRAEIEASLARRAKREDETQRKINENNARVRKKALRANRKKKQKK